MACFTLPRRFDVPVKTTGGGDVLLERGLILAKVVPDTGQFSPRPGIENSSKLAGQPRDREQMIVERMEDEVAAGKLANVRGSSHRKAPLGRRWPSWWSGIGPYACFLVSSPESMHLYFHKPGMVAPHAARALPSCQGRACIIPPDGSARCAGPLPRSQNTGPPP